MTIQNDFLVNTEWSQGNSRACSQDRGENSGKKWDFLFFVFSAFWVVTLIKWLLQAISSGKILLPKTPGLKKIFFLQRHTLVGWYSEVKQQFDGFYCDQFLMGNVLRMSIFLFKISKINNKSCLRWPEHSSRSFLRALKCAFSLQLRG